MKLECCGKLIMFGLLFLTGFFHVGNYAYAELQSSSHQTNMQAEIPPGKIHKCLLELNLKDDQKDIVYNFLKNQQLEIDNLMTELKQKGETLNKVGRSADKQTMKNKLQEIGNLRIEIKNKRSFMIEKIREMLTNKQRELFNKCLDTK